MKGGHLDDAESPDWLFTRDGEQRLPRRESRPKHPRYWLYSVGGAGGPASALRGLGANRGGSQGWLSAALAQADSLEVGHGIGPVHHFHVWW